MAWQSRAAQRRAADPARLLGLDPPAEGVEVRAGEEPVPAEARDAMDSLRAQAAVALERTELAAELARRASVDPLTGLANRTAFSRRLREALAGHDEGGPPGDHPSGAPALLLLDLDDFKTINDSLGHSSGDEVLRVVAERLRSCLQPGDVAARLGGDEFAMLVPRVGGEAEAVALGQRLAAILRTPVTVAGREVLARASVGVRMARGGDEDPERLLRDADMAMYAAKTAGRAGVRVFDTAMHTRAVQRLDFEAALRRAVIRQQFTVRYQLVVELPDGGLAGLEALVRWDHPDRGPVMPGALGVHLAIDDFGTGYSALAYLKTLPVDTLKLAKPFVDGLLRGAEEAALTNAILRIADLLGLQVVAGGIEHEAQALELDRLGCPLGQGFHFARPLDQFAVEALLVAEQARRPLAPAPGCVTPASGGSWETMLASLTGLGLSAAAGLNAYIPLLLVGVLARFTDVITLPEPYRWIQSGWAIAIVSVLLVAELVLDKVAVVDHVNDVVQTLVRPTVGGVIFAATTAAEQADASTWMQQHPWVGVLLGVVTAGIVHATKATARPVVNATTVGAGTPVVSAAEDAASLGMSLIAVFLPILTLVVLILLGWAAVAMFRRARRRRRSAAF